MSALLPMKITAFAFVTAGLLQCFIAWVRYRLPEVPLWRCWVPAWRADDYLAPIGCALWVGGLVLGAGLEAALITGRLA